MKIKLSKSQWEIIGKKAGWSKQASESVSYQELFKRFLKDNKSPKEAAEEILSILSHGAFDAVEEPKRTELINKIIEKCKS